MIVPGDPYKSRFPSKFDSVCVNHVACPDFLLMYFKYYNVVDTQNKARQFDWEMEKNWVTQDAYFFLYATLNAMNFMDSWKSFNSLHIYGGEEPTTIEYDDILVLEMIEYGR